MAYVAYWMATVKGGGRPCGSHLIEGLDLELEFPL